MSRATSDWTPFLSNLNGTPRIGIEARAESATTPPPITVSNVLSPASPLSIWSNPSSMPNNSPGPMKSRMPIPITSSASVGGSVPTNFLANCCASYLSIPKVLDRNSADLSAQFSRIVGSLLVREEPSLWNQAGASISASAFNSWVACSTSASSSNKSTNS